MKNELYHHGIDGQRWGVMHGPPYPLSRAEHRAVVNSQKSSEKRNLSWRSSRKHAKRMNDQDLNATIDRLKREEEYRNLVSKDKVTRSQKRALKKQQKQQKVAQKEQQKLAKQVSAQSGGKGKKEDGVIKKSVKEAIGQAIKTVGASGAATLAKYLFPGDESTLGKFNVNSKGEVSYAATGKESKEDLAWAIDYVRTSNEALLKKDGDKSSSKSLGLWNSFIGDSTSSKTGSSLTDSVLDYYTKSDKKASKKFDTSLLDDLSGGSKKSGIIDTALDYVDNSLISKYIDTDNSKNKTSKNVTNDYLSKNSNSSILDIAFDSLDNIASSYFEPSDKDRGKTIKKNDIGTHAKKTITDIVPSSVLDSSWDMLDSDWMNFGNSSSSSTPLLDSLISNSESSSSSSTPLLDSLISYNKLNEDFYHSDAE